MHRRDLFRAVGLASSASAAAAQSPAVPGLSAVKHRRVNTNGIALHIAEQGTGPLVLLVHGFPESWYSWRHQIPALAAAGFHVVAPDMRGYGQSDLPHEVEAYSILHLVGDMVGLVSALDRSSWGLLVPASSDA